MRRALGQGVAPACASVQGRAQEGMHRHYEELAVLRREAVAGR